MYASINFRTKKQFREAVKDGVQVTVYQPGPFGGNEPLNGKVCVEGPWYPEPHKWWAEVTLENGLVTKVK